MTRKQFIYRDKYYVSAKELAKAIGVSRIDIYNKCQRGKKTFEILGHECEVKLVYIDPKQEIDEDEITIRKSRYDVEAQNIKSLVYQMHTLSKKNRGQGVTLKVYYRHGKVVNTSFVEYTDIMENSTSHII